jgi:hypothetical protein
MIQACETRKTPQIGCCPEELAGSQIIDKDKK